MKQLSILFLIIFSFISCRNNDPDPDDEMMVENDLSLIEDDFSLANSTWYFQVVEASGFVFGSERYERDDDPEGFVKFNEDGTGIYDFQVEIIGTDAYSKLDIPIEWARVSKDSVLIVEIEEWERDTFYWDLQVANENVVKANWDLYITSSNFATFEASLTPEP